MTPRRRGALGGARQGRRERRYAGISARLRTRHRAAQRVPPTQSFISKRARRQDTKDAPRPTSPRRSSGRSRRDRRARARRPAPQRRLGRGNQPLQPDLEQAAPYDLSGRTSGTSAKPRFFLGFAQLAAGNLGDGPLVVVGSRPSTAQPSMKLVQQIRRSDGSTRTTSVDDVLSYVTALTHSHWHLLGFMRYELRSAGGGRVLRDNKTGFCLGDRYRTPATARSGRRADGALHGRMRQEPPQAAAAPRGDLDRLWRRLRPASRGAGVRRHDAAAGPLYARAPRSTRRDGWSRATTETTSPRSCSSSAGGEAGSCRLRSKSSRAVPAPPPAASDFRGQTSSRPDATMPQPSRVAQLAEHPAVNRRVVGSSPTAGAHLVRIWYRSNETGCL